ncbi:MAG: SurA N-terminal domain-containing protein [Cyclobacteriaceae bacterium]
MALIGILRNKMGKIVVGAIMVTMLSFILTDLIGNSTLLGGGQNPDIAEIAGESITNAKFQTKVDELSYNFALNTGRNPAQQEIDGIRNQAWNALIMESAYQSQFDELGLVLTTAEQVDMVQGNNISPEIQQFFRDPQTGEFSRDNVTNFLASVSQAPPQQQASWISFENSLTPSRLVSKYQNLMVKSNYVTKYEAKEEYTAQNATATIEYVYVPYLTVNDSSVTVSDSELQAYLSDHSEEFEREESRNIEYVIFDLKPSQEDSAIVSREVAGLQEELVNSSNDSSFVVVNSDDPYSFLTYQIDNLPLQLKDGENARPEGYVSDPEIINGNYEFFKLSRVDRISTDSILYRVAKIRKEFFTSDETVNAIYREADLFAASSGNTEEFRKNAEESGYRILKAANVNKNAERVGVITEGRSIALWLYNDAEKGAVSDVKEINDQYVVATMTDIQRKGTANLESVRNQITSLVRNDKKGDQLVEQLNNMGSNDLNEISATYGEGARTGSADVQLFSSNISTVGYAPEVIGLTFALNEEETTRAFKVRDGVVMVKLISKALPEELEDYTAFGLQLAQKRLGYTAVVADFPYTYFRVLISRNIDSAIKEFADIEDMRYKFF